MEKPTSMGPRFAIIHRYVRQQINEYMKDEDITGAQLCVMAELHRLEQRGEQGINQRALENLCHVTHPTMTDILSRLEKKGFIQCRRSDDDRRAKVISSTEKAIRLKEAVRRADSEVFDRLCAAFTPEQRSQLESLTDIMLDTIFNDMERGEDSLDKETCKKCKRV